LCSLDCTKTTLFLPQLFLLYPNISLDIIQEIKSSFENNERFVQKPKIRIALHVAQAGEISQRFLNFQLASEELKIFKDIAGEAVINTARIEPVVMPDYIFCSEPFAKELQAFKMLHANEGIETHPLGKYKLGKSHDEFEIELFSVYHLSQAPDFNALQAHIDEKLGKREQTYQEVSPLASGMLNLGTLIQGNVTLNQVTQGDNGISVQGNSNQINKTEIESQQNAEKIYNIEKIDKADFS
jgi:hypothetical protein